MVHFYGGNFIGEKTMEKKYGSHAVCGGCSYTRREVCAMCGQCDELDPFSDMEDLGMDPGEPDGDPFEAFSGE